MLFVTTHGWLHSCLWHPSFPRCPKLGITKAPRQERRATSKAGEACSEPVIVVTGTRRGPRFSMTPKSIDTVPRRVKAEYQPRIWEGSNRNHLWLPQAERTQNQQESEQQGLEDAKLKELQTAKQWTAQPDFSKNGLAGLLAPCPLR